ncbi:hypothetical protein niasHT_020121 [Heterodera trifolii]|uniref:Transmembrane protein n=1 Tax=Heterodera trifolii TaxID=157864 RepID=A0ABD2LJN6_9BILA
MSAFLRYLPKFRHRLLFLGGAFASVGVCATAAVLCHQNQNNGGSLLNLSKCAQNYCADRFLIHEFLRRRESPKEKMADQSNNEEEDGGEKMPKNANVLRIADQFKKQMEVHEATEKQRMNAREIRKQQKMYKESLSKFAFEPICPIISDGIDGKEKEKKETKETEKEEKEEKRETENEQWEEKQKKSTEGEEKEQNEGQKEETDKEKKEEKEKEETNKMEQNNNQSSSRQTDEGKNRQMDEIVNRQTDKSKNRQTDKSKNRQTDKSKNRQTDKSKNRQMGESRNRQMDEIVNRQTDKSKNRQTKDRAAVALVKMNRGLTRETAKGKSEGIMDVEKQRIAKVFWTLCYLMEALAGMANGKNSFKLPKKVPTFTELLMNAIRRFWKFLCFLFKKLCPNILYLYFFVPIFSFFNIL